MRLPYTLATGHVHPTSTSTTFDCGPNYWATRAVLLQLVVHDNLAHVDGAVRVRPDAVRGSVNWSRPVPFDPQRVRTSPSSVLIETRWLKQRRSVYSTTISHDQWPGLSFTGVTTSSEKRSWIESEGTPCRFSSCATVVQQAKDASSVGVNA
jgi:hypothetical protein